MNVVTRKHSFGNGIAKFPGHASLAVRLAQAMPDLVRSRNPDLTCTGTYMRCRKQSDVQHHDYSFTPPMGGSKVPVNIITKLSSDFAGKLYSQCMAI